MAKKPFFVCDTCGYETPKWMGKCPRCGAWDTIRESLKEGPEATVHQRPAYLADDDVPEERLVTGIEELDRVLGGGLMGGSSVLLGGDPGIGKTTLSFEIAAKLAVAGAAVLYVSGEESLRQLSLRRKRLKLNSGFPLLATNRLGDILDAVAERHYDLVVVDSIQSVHNPDLSMLPGSIGQVKDTSARLITDMKGRETAHLLIGHVTKEGAIAGPKLLEHMVDTVLYFEGDKMLSYRMVRAIKNRFGSIDEVGIFQMTQEGLVGVENPSEFFIADRVKLSSGSALFPCVTGSRPILLEVQAIAPRTNFPNPRRLSLGYDLNRLFILIAVLEKAANISLVDRDIYVNVTGGMRVNETAVDLAVAAAILSSHRDSAVGRDTALFGEVGLTGEIRKVLAMETRVKGCQRIGIRRVICPGVTDPPAGLEVVPIKNLKDLLSLI